MLVLGKGNFTCSNTACLSFFFTEIGMKYNFPDRKKFFLTYCRTRLFPLYIYRLSVIHMNKFLMVHN